MGHRRTGRKKTSRRNIKPTALSHVPVEVRRAVKDTEQLLRRRDLLPDSHGIHTVLSDDNHSVEDEWRELPTLEDSIREELSHVDKGLLFVENGLSFPNEEVDDDFSWWASEKDGGSTSTFNTTDTTDSSAHLIELNRYWGHLVKTLVEAPYDVVLDVALAASLLNFGRRRDSLLWAKLRSILKGGGLSPVLNDSCFWLAVPILGSFSEHSLWLPTDTIGRTLRRDPTLDEIVEVDD